MIIRMCEVPSRTPTASRRAPLEQRIGYSLAVQSDAAWQALGELLTVEVERATSDFTSRFASEITLRLQYFKTTAAQRQAVDRAVRTQLDTSTIALSYAGETQDLVVRRTLRTLWEYVDGEHAAEERWKELARVIQEELDSVDAEGDTLIAALGDVEAQTTDRRAWIWPLEPRGHLREALTQWREGAAARMRISPDQLLDPASVDDRPLFARNEVTTNISNLSVWLTERAAWARALHSLEPILACFQLPAVT
jgi:hypothetical protein